MAEEDSSNYLTSLSSPLSLAIPNSTNSRATNQTIIPSPHQRL
jgi:hypothetical protein